MLKKISYLLSKKDKRNLFLIFLLILGSAFLDLVGVSAILPIIELLEKGNPVVQSSSLLSSLNNLFGFGGDYKKLCLVLLAFMAFLFILKCAYSLLSTYVINRYTLGYSRKLTNKLMTAYLLFPYEFHLDNNSSTLIRKSTYDVSNFTYAITSILNFLVKVASAIAIIVFLFVKDWKVTLILFGLLVIFSIIVLLLIKPQTKKIGKDLQQLNSQNYKYLSQAFNGIKESKIYNTEIYFLDEYDKNREGINKLSLKRAVLNNIPSQALELVGMVGICLALAIVILIGTEPKEIVITFSVFAYAVIKLLPSVTTITTTINSLQFYEASVNSLFEDIKQAEDASYVESNEEVEPFPFDKDIVVKNVDFYYSSIPEKKVLNNVSLKIEKNTSVAISGVSGVGKTTLIDVILGLLPCRSGEVLCDGTNIATNLRGWRKNISYIPQNIYLCDDTIRNNVAFGVSKSEVNDDMVWDALEKAQLKEFVQGLPKGLDTVVGERGIRISGGQRQRIGIARAFFRNTNIIVFDEATSALDYETEKNIFDHVSKYSNEHTLIVITHRLNTIDSCEIIYKVEEGFVQKIK